MAVVTDKEYHMEGKQIKIFDKMIKRQKKKFDHLIIYDGDEGIGKTTKAVADAYYLAQMTGKNFTVENVFFDLDKMMKFAAENEQQVILWDEAALGALSDDHHNKMQKKLIQILMVARKKGHFWLFCIPKFFKLRDYIVLDRSIGLVHVYSPDDEHRGCFAYFGKVKKNNLYHFIKKNKYRDYKRYDFLGRFVDVTNKDLIDWDAYEKKKDEAILSAFADKNTVSDTYRRRYYLEWHKLSVLAEHCKLHHGYSLRKTGRIIGHRHRHLTKGLELPQKYPEIFENPFEKKPLGSDFG